MTYWKDEVLLFPRDISPPAFMWHPVPTPDLTSIAAYHHSIRYYNRIQRLLDEQGNGDLSQVADDLLSDTSRPAVIQRHYKQIRGFLEEGGYGDLSQMADRIETRLAAIDDELETLDSRVLYLKAQPDLRHPRLAGN